MLSLVRSRLQAGARIALFAVAVLALVPTLSHALAALRTADPWSEVCSAPGRSLPRGDAGVPAATLVHCALCIVADGAAPLASSPERLWSAPCASRDLPVRAASAAPATPLRHAVQPRAPPAA